MFLDLHTELHQQQYAGTVNKCTTRYIICSTAQPTQSTEEY